MSIRRAIRIVMKDGSYKELELSKATSIKSDLEMLHLDGLPDGSWRLIFSKDIVEDFSKIERFDIVRED